jgi:hypothetical protein
MAIKSIWICPGEEGDRPKISDYKALVEKQNKEIAELEEELYMANSRF